jgi:hypothetical protein
VNVVNIPGFLIGQVVLEAVAVVAVLWGLWLLISGKARREFEDGSSGRSLPDNSAEASDKG